MKNHSNDTYFILKDHNNEYVESRDIQWDEPWRYRKLSLEATRGEAVKHTSPPTLDSAPTNQFAALISNKEGKDDEEDDDSGDDEDTGEVAEAQPAARVGQQQQEQQQGAPRLQQELHQLAGHNNNPAYNNSNARAGILGRTRLATKSI